MKRNRRINRTNRNQSNFNPLATDVVIVEGNGRKSHPSDGRILITTLSGTAAFSTTKISLNPGLTMGTREANIASGFGKYTARNDWKLEFVPRKAGTYAGLVSAAVDYEAEDEPPTNQIALSTFENYGTAPVRAHWFLPLRKRLMFDGVQWKIVRCGPTATSLTFTDSCAIMFATDGCDDTTTIIDVYLHYSINYTSRQTAPTAFIPNNLIRLNLSANQTFATTVPEAIAYDESVVAGFDVTNTLGVITLPCGSYRISGNFVFTDSAVEVFTGTISLLIDGVAAVPPQGVCLDGSNVGAGTCRPGSFEFYASSSASFTAQVSASLTGPAGTLLALQDLNFINIEALN